MNKHTTTQGNRRSPRLWALALVAGSASSASATEKIVVYRSQYEQMNDQFWFDHPEYILGAIGLLVGALVVYGFVSLVQHLRRR